MSEHYLVVIPRDPKAELPDTANAIRQAMTALPDTGEARIKDYGKLQFIDAGENFERIGCPTCAHSFTIPEWHAWMDADWHGEDGFHLHIHDAPCCGAKMTLNDLIYEWPQGFARWFVSVQNTGRDPLTDEEVSRLEAVAGLPLKAIAQMY